MQQSELLNAADSKEEGKCFCPSPRVSLSVASLPAPQGCLCLPGNICACWWGCTRPYLHPPPRCPLARSQPRVLKGTGAESLCSQGSIAVSPCSLNQAITLAIETSSRVVHHIPLSGRAPVEQCPSPVLLHAGLCSGVTKQAPQGCRRGCGRSVKTSEKLFDYNHTLQSQLLNQGH